MTRRDSINRLVDNVAQHGAANGAQATGPALAALFRAALEEEDAHAAKTRTEPLDPRRVLIGVMTNMRQLMATVRDELDGMDGLGKYR